MNSLSNFQQDLNLFFDVGANVGEWSKMTAALFPKAKIYAFEAVPQTFEHFQNNTLDITNIKGFNFGLSNRKEKKSIFYNSSKDQLATFIDDLTENLHNHKPQKIECDLEKGDTFCKNNNVSNIDFLKIDVEGYENRVLEGFEKMLENGSIKIIQFEYGLVNIDTHFLLKDFYKMLNNYDMVVGKIYPKYVDFREYKYEDENFFGPNYLAVHSSYREIINCLKP